MKQFTDAQAAKWERARQSGSRRYILLHGVLGWGVPTAVLWSALMAALAHGGGFLHNLAVAIVLFPLGGIAFGAWIWSIKERKYSEWNRSRAS
jgi:hypothetical protein